MISLTYSAPSIVMIGGVPGSGKSTFAEKCDLVGAEIISADDCRGWVQVHHGFPFSDFRRELIPEARERFFLALDSAVEGQQNVILDAAYLTTHARREIWNRVAGMNTAYQNHLIMLTATRRECLDGMQGRERIVPREDFDRYWHQYEDFLHDYKRGVLEVALDTVLTLSRKDCDSIGIINFA